MWRYIVFTVFIGILSVPYFIIKGISLFYWMLPISLWVVGVFEIRRQCKKTDKINDFIKTLTKIKNRPVGSIICPHCSNEINGVIECSKCCWCNKEMFRDD